MVLLARTTQTSSVALLLVLALWAWFGEGVVGTPLSCVSGQFTPHSRAFVTCLFDTDLGVTRDNFQVLRYPPNATATDTESLEQVLVCNWARSGQLKCHVARGYSYNNVASHRVTLVMDDVTDSHVGYYVCQRVPGDPDVPVHNCSLALTGGGRGRGEVTAGSATSRDDDRCQNQTGVLYGILALQLVILILLPLCCVGLFLYLRRHYTLQRKAAISDPPGHSEGSRAPDAVKASSETGDRYEDPPEGAQAEAVELKRQGEPFLPRDTHNGNSLSSQGKNSAAAAAPSCCLQ